jgi:hypothetical protein
VADLIQNRLEAIRTDPTAHRLRLEAMLPSLIEEFRGRRSHGEIRACADAVLNRFDDAPIRSHVDAIAHRRTRECLAAPTCDALTKL